MGLFNTLSAMNGPSCPQNDLCLTLTNRRKCPSYPQHIRIKTTIIKINECIY